MNYHETTHKFPCCYIGCTESFPSQSLRIKHWNAEEHYNKEAGAEVYSCDCCPRVYGSKQTLSAHRGEHKTEKYSRRTRPLDPAPPVDDPFDMSSFQSTLPETETSPAYTDPGNLNAPHHYHSETIPPSQTGYDYGAPRVGPTPEESAVFAAFARERGLTGSELEDARRAILGYPTPSASGYTDPSAFGNANPSASGYTNPATLGHATPSDSDYTPLQGELAGGPPPQQSQQTTSTGFSEIQPPQQAAPRRSRGRASSQSGQLRHRAIAPAPPRTSEGRQEPSKKKPKKK